MTEIGGIYNNWTKGLVCDYGKLLDEHLSGNTSSEEWKQCVNKDQQLIPYDNLVKILKEIKGITKV